MDALNGAIGVVALGKGAREMQEALLRVCWAKVAEHRERGHQVLVKP